MANMATCLTACPDQWLCEQFCISVLDFLYMFTILQQDYVASTRITGSHYQMHPQNIRLGSIRVLVCIQFALHSRLPRRMSVRSLKTVLSYFQISFLKECGRASTRSELTNTFGILQLEEQVEPCNKFKLDYQFSTVSTRGPMHPVLDSDSEYAEGDGTSELCTTRHTGIFPFGSGVQ